MLCQRADDLVDDGVVRLVARLHDDVGLRIERLAQRHQLLDLFGQRPVVAPLGPFHQHVEIGLQPDRDAFDVDQLAGVRVHDGAAAGRQHLRAVVQQPGDHARLAGAEIGLAVLFENLRNGHAGGAFDLAIGVDERDPEPAGKPAADRRLAGAHHADEHDGTAAERAHDGRFQAIFRGF